MVRVRALEEEQSLAALEAAVSEVRRLEGVLDVAGARARIGRELVHRSAETGEALERVTGLAEERMAMQAARFLTEDLEEARELAEEARAQFLARRVEKRQAEALLDAALKNETARQARRLQQDVEDWDRARRMRGESQQVPTKADPSTHG